MSLSKVKRYESIYYPSKNSINHILIQNRLQNECDLVIQRSCMINLLIFAVITMCYVLEVDTPKQALGEYR